VHALGQDLDLQGAAGHSAQAGGEPELIVIAGARVEADHQGHLAQAGAQGVDVGQQIVRAAFLAGLDQADDAGVGRFLGLQGLHGGNAGVHRIAVVGATAAIQLAVFVLGGPGAQVVAPAAELGLLVQVPIHQHGLAAVGLGRGYLEEQHRGAAFQADDLQREAFDLLRLDPLRGIAQHGVEQALLGPVGGKGRRLGGNGDVVGDLAHQIAVPALADLGQGLLGLEDGRRNTGVHGVLLVARCARCEASGIRPGPGKAFLFCLRPGRPAGAAAWALSLRRRAAGFRRAARRTRPCSPAKNGPCAKSPSGPPRSAPRRPPARPAARAGRH